MSRVKLAVLVISTLLFVSAGPALNPSVSIASEKKTEKKKKALPGTPVLWRSPGNITARNLYWGAGGQRMKPDLRRVTFLKEEKGGYSRKYRVRDASGRIWVAKLSKESQPETAANRLMWAVGYVTEIDYLAPHVEIAGKGTYKNVRFEARPANIDRADAWEWDQNPFLGTREFQGLKVMMALLNNWDIKDSNNKIFVVNGRSGTELRYVISDLGATFGSSRSTPILWTITRSRNEPVKYAKANFVDKVKSRNVRFHYGGKRNSLFKDVTVEDAWWIGRLLSRLRDQQIRDAFRAANYTPGEIELLTREVRIRINELVNIRPTEQLGHRR